MCRCGPGPAALRSPRLPAPPAALGAPPRGAGGAQGRQRVIVSPCEMCPPCSSPLLSRTSVCHQTRQTAPGGWMGGERGSSSSPPRRGGRRAPAGFSAPDVPVCRWAAGGAKLMPAPGTSKLGTEPAGAGRSACWGGGCGKRRSWGAAAPGALSGPSGQASESDHHFPWDFPRLSFPLTDPPPTVVNHPPLARALGWTRCCCILAPRAGLFVP